MFSLTIIIYTATEYNHVFFKKNISNQVRQRFPD